MTAGFPKSELYGLTNQIRRASVSIPTNIAEGCGRGSDADFARFLQIAFGSSNEVDYLLLLSFDLGMIAETIFAKLNSQIVEIKRMVSGLLKKLKGDR